MITAWEISEKFQQQTIIGNYQTNKKVINLFALAQYYVSCDRIRGMKTNSALRNEKGQFVKGNKRKTDTYGGYVRTKKI